MYSNGNCQSSMFATKRIRNIDFKLLVLRQLRQIAKVIEPAVNKQDNEVEFRKQEPICPLSTIEPNNLPEIVPSFVPTFNFAAYVNKSESLQQLVKLGVDLSSIEKRKGLVKFVLGLDFNNDMKSHITFLNDLGVSPEDLGKFITKNPLIFKEDLDDLTVRVNYLEAKKFSPAQVQRIVTKNPFWLMFSTRRIDKRLGYFQSFFQLKGNEVRLLAVKQPRLITYHLQNIQDSTFCIKEEMGFDNNEIKDLLLKKPKLWIVKSDDLIERFDYVHRRMKLPHEIILKFPDILLSRKFRIKQRHEFLDYLGKAQYDPSKELYVSPKLLVEGTDRDFVLNVAKSDMQVYDVFLRTL